MMFELLVRTNPAPVPMIRTGGAPELTASDIAAACSSADPFGLDILLVKTAGVSATGLFEQVHGLVKRLATEQSWKLRKKQRRLHDFASLVMFEYMQEPRCPLCHGTKYYKAKPCTPCKGSGYIRMNDALRAEAIGINRSVWKRVWKKRYNEVISLVNYYESKAVYSIKQKLR